MTSLTSMPGTASAAAPSPANPSGRSAPAGASAPRQMWFFIQAEADDPGLLPRTLGQFAKRSLVPDHLHCSRGPDGLDLDLRVDRVDPATGDILAAVLRQTVGVRSVLTTAG